MSAVYRNTRPELTVERTGGKNLGRCYNATYVTVTSLKKLSKEILQDMRTMGLLVGYGQEFRIHSQCDGDEEPAGHDSIPCVDDETGEPAMNPYSGKPYQPIEVPYYQYKVEHRVDSGD
jgi:hypothetical protein